jgi:hypothetical protein
MKTFSTPRSAFGMSWHMRSSPTKWFSSLHLNLHQLWPCISRLYLPHRSSLRSRWRHTDLFKGLYAHTSWRGQINGRMSPAFPIIKLGKTRLPTKYAHECTTSWSSTYVARRSDWSPARQWSTERSRHCLCGWRDYHTNRHDRYSFLQNILNTYEQATGAARINNISKALLLAKWNTCIDVLGIPYVTEARILGITYHRTINKNVVGTSYC